MREDSCRDCADRSPKRFEYKEKEKQMIDNGGRVKRPGKDKIWLRLALMFGVSSLIGTGGYYGYRYYC